MSVGGGELRIFIHHHLELEPLSQPLHPHLYIIWLWWPVGLVFLDPTGLWQSEKQLLQASTPRAVHRQWTEALPQVFL